MYNLYQIDFHNAGHRLIGEVRVCEECGPARPNLMSVFEMITKAEKLDAYVDKCIFLQDVSETVEVFTSNSSPAPATQKFVAEAKIIASFSVDGDETADYILVEEERVSTFDVRDEDEKVIAEALSSIARDLAAIRQAVEGRREMIANLKSSVTGLADVIGEGRSE